MQSFDSFPEKQTRLAPFLAFSALAHAALLLFVVLPSPQRPHALPVQLALAQPATAPAAAGIHETTPPAPPRATQAEPQGAAVVMAAAPDEAPIAPEPAPTAATVSEREERADQQGEIGARVIAQVRAALTRYFIYPVAAQRKGWEGEVLLGFRVTAEGRIVQVEVVRSSGHPLLDDAARNSLTRVGTLPEYAARGNEPLQLQLPIIYRLEG